MKLKEVDLTRPHYVVAINTATNHILAAKTKYSTLEKSNILCNYNMKITDIQKGKTFYQMRITRAGQIYELNKVNIDAIMGNIESIFQIRYTIPNSSISYTDLYSRLYVEESNSPYFIYIGGELYLTLPNKQALMKAVRAQITRYSTYPQSELRTVNNYRDSMKKIKQLHLYDYS